jgi:type II secretory pathway component PulJ
VTLTDLLASVAVLGLVLSATVIALDQGQRAYRHGVARVEAQQAARIALERMAREIRQAGTGLAPAALSVAERARIVLHFDLDGDGVASGRREVVTWLLAGRVLRRDAGGGAQPIIEDVRDLELTYFDVAGRATTTPDDVRAVGITLTTESGLLAAGATTMSTRVRLRNR